MSDNTDVLLFRAGLRPGQPSVLHNHPHRVRARKRKAAVQVIFARTALLVQTLEGNVPASAGDAIITGAHGEEWPVPGARFAEKYRATDGLQQGDDGTYLALPIEVAALKIDQTFAVLQSDGVARLNGQAGDWLIDYGDGSLGIVADAIFDQIYDIMEPD